MQKVTVSLQLSSLNDIAASAEIMNLHVTVGESDKIVMLIEYGENGNMRTQLVQNEQKHDPLHVQAAVLKLITDAFTADHELIDEVFTDEDGNSVELTGMFDC